jgi:hypothetical protein
MAVPESVNAAGLVREHLESASPDVLRATGGGGLRPAAERTFGRNRA